MMLIHSQHPNGVAINQLVQNHLLKASNNPDLALVLVNQDRKHNTVLVNWDQKYIIILVLTNKRPVVFLYYMYHKSSPVGHSCIGHTQSDSRIMTG